MNPLALMQLKSSLEKFQQNHPKFIQFAQTIVQIGLKEGTVLECKVITTDGREIHTNLKITNDDLELLEKIKEATK